MRSYLFCTFLDKNEKNNHHIEGGTKEFHPHVQDFAKARSRSNRSSLGFNFPYPHHDPMNDSLFLTRKHFDGFFRRKRVFFEDRKWWEKNTVINHNFVCREWEIYPRVKDLQPPRLGKPCRGLQIFDTRVDFPVPV